MPASLLLIKDKYLPARRVKIDLYIFAQAENVKKNSAF